MNMLKRFSQFVMLGIVGMIVHPLALLAEEAAAGGNTGGGIHKMGLAIGAGIGLGLAALGGAVGQGLAANAALGGMSRNPEAGGKMFVPMILCLVFIESLVLFTFAICYFLQSKI